MIAPTPFFADRGAHTQILEEALALQKRGHEIKICTYGLGRDVPGVQTVRCWVPKRYKKLAAGPSYTKILLLPVLLARSAKEVKAFHPDLVHAHLHEGAIIARILRLRFQKIPAIFDLQGSLSGECLQHGFVAAGGLRYRTLRWIERRILQWFPIITQSGQMVAEAEAIAKRTLNITNVLDGVDVDKFCPRPPDTELVSQTAISLEHPRVLYMGVFAEYQGVDLLLSSFTKVIERVPDAQLLLIGYPNELKYREVAARLGIINNSFFFGRVDYSEVPRYLSLATVAIAPKIADTEGDGKIYNYMAMGLPIVAFDRAVSREILGDAALFAENKSVDDLADKIIEALTDPDLAEKLGRLARNRAVEALTWNNVAERIENVYLKKLSKAL